MEYFKISDYQLTNINNWINITRIEVENAVLQRFNVYNLRDIYFRDYDDVVGFIQDLHIELSNKRKKKVIK